MKYEHFGQRVGNAYLPQIALLRLHQKNSPGRVPSQLVIPATEGFVLSAQGTRTEGFSSRSITDQGWHDSWINDALGGLCQAQRAWTFKSFLRLVTEHTYSIIASAWVKRPTKYIADSLTKHLPFFRGPKPCRICSDHAATSHRSIRNSGTSASLCWR